MAVYEADDKMVFAHADDANVPVDIWIHAPDEECSLWVLTAANYMPRKGCLHPHGFEQRADTREELAALVTTHIAPLYRAALSCINGIASGSNDHLYYWEVVR